MARHGQSAVHPASIPTPCVIRHGKSAISCSVSVPVVGIVQVGSSVRVAADPTPIIGSQSAIVNFPRIHFLYYIVILLLFFFM